MFGLPLSPLYSLAMKIRCYLYKGGFLKQHRLSAPVISIGNLTLGGTVASTDTAALKKAFILLMMDTVVEIGADGITVLD